jgi:hypothetical protein
VPQEVIERMRTNFEFLDINNSAHLKIPLASWEDFVFDVYRQRTSHPEHFCM